MNRIHTIKRAMLLMLALLLPLTVGAVEVEINGLWYDLTSGGTAQVIQYKSQKYTGNITIPNSVTYSGKSYSVTSIGESAFEDCKNLTSIAIPDGVTFIDEYAFNNCVGLTSVIIPNGVTSISQSVFQLCSGLTSISIPNSVTSIGSCAFSGCRKLVTVIIPSSVTSIGESAFSNCKSLSSLTIPNAVKSISDNAFGNCTGLTSIIVESDNSKYDSRDNCNAIIETASNTLIRGCNTTVIPSGVTSIGRYAFSNLSGLTTITIPSSVTTIGYGAFEYCSGLTSISIPDDVTSIGNSAFGYCSGLTSIIIPNNVASIANGTFQYCTSLTSVTIGSRVTSIGERGFYNCPLSDVYCLTESAPICDESSLSTFLNSNINNATLYVPLGRLNAYKNASPWNQFKEIIEVDTRLEQTLELAELPVMTYGDAAYELPATTAEGKTITWSSSDENVAAISGNTITVTGAGTATITATQEGDNEYKPFTREFTLTVEEKQLTKGDLNGDGTVSISDVVLIIDVMAGTITDADQVAAADVNGDGSVSITDCVAAIDLIAAQSGAGSRMTNVNE